jgi:hypothetical protein
MDVIKTFQTQEIAALKTSFLENKGPCTQIFLRCVTINLKHRMHVCIDNSFEISEFSSPPCKYGFSTYYDTKTRLASWPMAINRFPFFVSFNKYILWRARVRDCIAQKLCKTKIILLSIVSFIPKTFAIYLEIIILTSVVIF